MEPIEPEEEPEPQQLHNVFCAQDIALIMEALRFSSDRHCRQMRKDGISPFINHPIQVAELLWRTGKVHDVTTIAGALLHDIVEDTPTTLDEITSLFGQEIAVVVADVTDDTNLSGAERKQRQLETAPHICFRAKQVKLADKICNIADMTTAPPRGWPLERRLKYMDWTKAVVDLLRGCNPTLENCYDQKFSSGYAHLTECLTKERAQLTDSNHQAA
ncbi:MAG: HD domain-containing protein [Pseudomonadota bacterium]